MRRYLFLTVLMAGVLAAGTVSVNAAVFNSKKNESAHPPKLVTPVPAPSTLYATPTQDTVRIPIVEYKDFAGTGLFFNYQGWFSLPGNVQVVGTPKMVINLSRSKTVADLSTLTVWVNDQPLQSISLTGVAAENAHIEIPIPLSLVQSSNSFDFRFYAVSASNSNDPCRDLDNPANWAVIHKDSYIEINYQYLPIEKLGFFPQPFVRSGRYFQPPLYVALPDDPDSRELEAAAKIIGYFGLQEPFAYPEIFSTFARDAAKTARDANILSLGDLDRNPFAVELRRSVPSETFGRLDDRKGLAVLLNSPLKKGRALAVITGANSKVLPNTSDGLLEEKLLRSTREFYTLIDVGKIGFFPRHGKRDVDFTLRSLGYYTTKLAGTFENSAMFQIRIPPYWELMKNSGVVLKTSFSPLLNPNSSLLSVLINDRLIKSFKLSGRDENRLYSVMVPDDFLDESSLSVTVSAALDVNMKKDCVNRYYDQAWIVFQDSSYFHLPHRIITDRSFQYFPGLFYDTDGTSRVKVVLPDRPTVRELNAFFNVVYAVASLASFEIRPTFEVLKASEAKKANLGDASLVFIGTFEDNPMMLEMNNFLPFHLDRDTNRPLEAELHLQPQFMQNVAVMQLAASPWNKKRNVFFLTGESDDLIEQASRYLLVPGNYAQWRGNYVVINGKGEFFANEVAFQKRTRQKQQLKYLFISIGVMALLSAVFGVYAYIRHRHSLKDPFKSV